MPEGGAPRALSLDEGITLIVSIVPASVYSAGSLETRLSDLDWVSTAAAAHHAVVEEIAEAGVTILPFRLFTIFSSEAMALAAFRDLRPALRRAFDRIRGKEEWVLRITQPDPSRAETTASVPRPADSGTSFLAGKAAARRERIDRAERVKADATVSYQALERLADAATTRAVEASGNLVLDAAFLVRPASVDALKDTLTRTAQRLLREGCAVRLTGPWPPYSFASLESPSYG